MKTPDYNRLDHPDQLPREGVKLADCGSYWSKILAPGEDKLLILETRELIRLDGLRFDLATGHTAGPRAAKTENELVALAVGARALVGEPDMLVVDVGSRDTKMVEFRDGRLCRMDWNAACGSSTGATVEMLGRHYGLAFTDLKPTEKWISVTCGVFAMERIIDIIGAGREPAEAVAMFVHGLARNVHAFCGRSEHIHLSGGFSESPCFLKSLERYSRVTPLGRTVPLEGLRILHSRPETVHQLRDISREASPGGQS